jgi:hypothetical protein
MKDVSIDEKRQIRILTQNLLLEKERLLCIELKPLESQLMMQTRASLEVLIPNDKYVKLPVRVGSNFSSCRFEQCLSLLRGATNTQKNNDSIDLAPPVSLTVSFFLWPTSTPVLTSDPFPALFYVSYCPSYSYARV